MTMMNKNYASGHRVFSRSSCTEPRDPAEDADAGRERASSPHGPLRLGASGVTERHFGRAIGAGGGGASLGCRTRFPRRAGGRRANSNAPRASRRLMPEKCGGVVDVAGSSTVPGQSNWTTRPWKTTGCATPGGGVRKKLMPLGELRSMASSGGLVVGWVRCACARCHLMMVAAASSGAARALGCRFRGIVGAGRGGALRTCAVPRGSLRLGGAALKFGLMSLVAPAATSNWKTSRDAY